MRNAPVPKGMVTAFLLGIAVKKECIVNAFNILSTSKRLTSRVLPLVENEVFFKKSTIFWILSPQSIKKGGLKPDRLNTDGQKRQK